MSTSKIIGDAGEHYALSQFSFNGIFGVKMPDNWKSYDLIIDYGERLHRVSVKTRTESRGWKSSKWFHWGKNDKFDFLVLIFKHEEGLIDSWILPRTLAVEYSTKPGEKAKDQNLMEIKWNTLLNTPSLEHCKENWQMNFILE
jgi:hypothetical protein